MLLAKADMAESWVEHRVWATTDIGSGLWVPHIAALMWYLGGIGTGWRDKS
jgi:hypothetical protein